jgi:hypothetical protein
MDQYVARRHEGGHVIPISQESHPFPKPQFSNLPLELRSGWPIAGNA